MIVPEIHGLRPMQKAEAAKFAEWERLERPYPWKETQFLETLNSSSQQTLVWEEEKALIGFGVLQIVQTEAYLLNIMIKTERRGQGKGKELLKKLIDWSRSCGATAFFLDVDPNNRPAMALYKSAGLRVSGHRPHGYPGGEESLLMRIEL
jgi:[ribosomal protein S18]-alanine N-acetyltransferase